MALLKNSFNLGTMAVGAGIILVAPVAIPLVGNLIRPVAKALIKGGIVAYREAEKSFEQMGKSMRGIVKEARTEIK